VSPATLNTGWQNNICTDGRPALVTHSHVGINTDIPDEALVVHGNVRVVGNIYQPSDERIKQNILIVNTQNQLDIIRKLNLYQYEFNDDWIQQTNTRKKKGNGCFGSRT